VRYARLRRAADMHAGGVRTEIMIAFIFPGQGSQHPGMGKDLAENFPAARQVFEEADAALGFALSEM